MMAARTGSERAQKKAGSRNCLPEGKGVAQTSGLVLRRPCTQTLHAIAWLPLAALAQNLDAFEALQDVTFDDEAGGPLETFML
jgi:hypothetical protein